MSRRSYADIGLDAVAADVGGPVVGASPAGTTFQTTTKQGIEYGNLIQRGAENLQSDVSQTLAWGATVSDAEIAELESYDGPYHVVAQAKLAVLKSQKALAKGKSAKQIAAESKYVEAWDDWKKEWDAFYLYKVGPWSTSMFKTMVDADWEHLETEEKTLHDWGKKYEGLGYKLSNPMPSLDDIKKSAPGNWWTTLAKLVPWAAGATIVVAGTVLVVWLVPRRHAPIIPQQEKP